MSTLAFQFEEITARELKPALLELDGISRATVEAHYKLYEGYVDKRNEILGKLASVDLASGEPGLLASSARSRSSSRSRSAGSRTTRSTSSTSAARAAIPTGSSAS